MKPGGSTDVEGGCRSRWAKLGRFIVVYGMPLTTLGGIVGAIALIKLMSFPDRAGPLLRLEMSCLALSVVVLIIEDWLPYKAPSRMKLCIWRACFAGFFFINALTGFLAALVFSGAFVGLVGP